MRTVFDYLFVDALARGYWAVLKVAAPVIALGLFIVFLLFLAGVVR